MHSDDLGGPTAMDLSPFAGEFDRPLDRFGAAVGEERPVQSAVASYQLGKADHWPVVIGRAAVQKLLGLRLDRADDCCGTMAQTIDCPALDEIEIFLSLLIGQPGAAPSTNTTGGRLLISIRAANASSVTHAGGAMCGSSMLSSFVVSQRTEARKHEGPRRCRQGPS